LNSRAVPRSEGGNPRIPFVLASDRPPLAPPGGRPLLVHVVVNIESWAFDRAMPRVVLPPPHGQGRVPDVPNFTWAEYGLRCGMPRLLKLFSDTGTPVSAFMNAAVVEDYPAVAAAVLGAGWEIVGHGHRQRTLSPDGEEALIAESLDALERFSGARPKGWLGPGLQETDRTPELLVRAGVEYVYDWVVDDLPCWLHTDEGRLLALPYTLELNDSVLFAVGRAASAELYERYRDTISALEPELETAPRVLTLALHPHLAGVPHRLVHVQRILEDLRARDDTTFLTGEGMAAWYRAAEAGTGGER
jgi:allantoinase